MQDRTMIFPLTPALSPWEREMEALPRRWAKARLIETRRASRAHHAFPRYKNRSGTARTCCPEGHLRASARSAICSLSHGASAAPRSERAGVRGKGSVRPMCCRFSHKHPINPLIRTFRADCFRAGLIGGTSQRQSEEGWLEEGHCESVFRLPPHWRTRNQATKQTKVDAPV